MSTNVMRLADPLAMIGQRIRDAWERKERGRISVDHQEWVEGSIQLATEIDAGQRLFRGNSRFRAWLIENINITIPVNDFYALCHLGARSDLRQILEATTPRAYQIIWGNIRPVRAPRAPRGTRAMAKRSARVTYKDAVRAIKLGTDYELLKNTSLRSPQELDALVHLINAFPADYNDIKARALAGEIVSAKAVLEDKGRQPPPSLELLYAAFRANHQFITKWQRATKSVKMEFLRKLTEEVDRE